MATQTIPTHSSARIRQVAGALIVALSNLLWFAYYIKTIFFVDYYKPGDERLMEETTWTLGIGVFFIIGFILLCTTATNKATRIASILAICTATLSLLANAYSQYNMWLIITEQTMGDGLIYIGAVLSFITTFIIPALWIYIYSIIIKGNSDMSCGDKRWIHVLILTKIGSFALYMYYIIAPFVVYNESDLSFTSPSLLSWTLLSCLIICVAEFRMGMSSAFKGNYSDMPAEDGTYSPLNRYFLALLIAVPIIVALWVTIISNAEYIENILNF